MRSAIFWVTALAAASVTATPWGSRANQKCASYCKESKKFAYQPGTIYVYDYTADTATQISGTSDEESRLHISAKAEFEAVSPCELVLRVRNVRLEESDPLDASSRTFATGADRFSEVMERHPLVFAFQDGTVEHMCPSSDEETWALNIKRGILSAFQNSMDNLDVPQKVHETDITGHCEANYTVVTQGRRGVTVRKTKDLLSCSGRNNHVSFIQSTPYTSASPVQSLPLMKCDNECEQVVSNKLLEKTTCTEVHVFQPFSNGNSGALTKVYQSLSYNTEKPSSEKLADVKRTRSSLLFVDEQEPGSLAGKENLALTVLNELLSTSSEEITSDVPKLFSRLVTVLRPLSYTQLSKIFYNVKDSRARKYLMDAAPLIGTAASMGFMRDLVRDQLISELETDMWLSSLAFQPKPTIDMIIAVAPLVAERPRQKALLGISAMINTYCRAESKCNSNPEVFRIVRDIEKVLGNGCRSLDSKEEQDILVALKALGNAGVVTNIDTLKRCYEENNPMIVRLAAIDAIRRVPCEDIDRTPLLSFFRNMNQDPELRIAAYLAVMRCPTPQLLDEIKQSLISEAVNQVGSFIWTHLTNLQETTSPSKQQIRQMLSSEFLKNKFNTDVRKFSRNFEASTFFEELNVGGTIDSNIIFSSKSYLPRSAMLNFTIDLFGQSINLLEIGARVEGFESLVESFFGPNGIVPEENLQKALQTIRGKREVDENSIKQLSSTYNVANEVSDQPEGNLYLRIFGNELFTNSFKGLNLKNENSPLAMLLKNAGKDTDFSKSFMFADASYKVPTIIGLPLSLTFNGTATLSLRMGGKFEVNGLSNVNIMGHFKPSAATEINGVMSVDAFVTRSGIQIQNLMHSSTGIDGKVVINGKEIVSVQVNMPKEKVEIFSRKSSLFLLHKGSQQSIRAKQTRVMSKTCSADNLSNLLGVQLCGEYEYHPSGEAAPRRPLNGPSNAAIYLKKTDAHTGYIFEYKFNVEQVRRQKVRSISLTLDTPNSRVNRRIATQLVLDEATKSVRALLQSPLNNLDLSGKYEFNDMLKSADFVLNVDKNEYAALRMALRTDIKGNSGRYEPSFLVTRKGRELVNLQGFYNFVQGSKYGFDLQLKQLTERPIRITGDVNTDGSKYDLNLAVKSHFLETSIAGNWRASSKIFSTKLRSDYSFFGATSQQLEVSAKYSKTLKGALQKISTSGVLQTSQFPEYSTEFSWDLQTATNYVENNGRLITGKTQWDIQQVYSSQGVRGQQDLTVRGSISCPKKGIDLLASYVQQNTDNSLTSTALLRTSPNTEWSSHLELFRKASPTHYSARMELSAPTNNFQLRSEIMESQSNQWDALAAFRSNQQEETSVTASFKNLSTAVKSQYAVELKTRGPLVETIDASSEFSASVSQTSLTFAGKYANERVSAVVEYNTATADEHRIEARFNSNDTPVFTTLIVVGTGPEKSVTVDIKSGRHITVNAKVVPGNSAILANFELFWDKERNLSKTVSFAGELRGGSGTAILKYPGRTISLKTAFKGKSVEAELEWESGKKIAVVLDIVMKNQDRRITGSLKTPFAGYENLAVETSFSNAKDDMKTQLTVTWRRERVSLTATSIKTSERLAGSVGIESTLVGFENIRFSIDAVSSIPETKFTSSLSENGRNFELTASYNRKNGRFSQALVLLTTPVEELDNFRIEVSREISAGSMDGKVEFVYPGNNQIVGTASVKKSSSEISGYVGVKSPFDLLRTVSSSFTYRNDGKIKKLSHTSELNDQKFAMDGSLTTETGMTTAQVMINIPFIEEINASLFHAFDGTQLKCNAQISLAKEHQVSASLEGRVVSLRDVDIAVDLKSLSQQGGFRLTHLVDGTRLKTSIETTLNGKTSAMQVTANSQGDKQARQIRAAAVFTTPIRGLADIRLNLDYNRNSKNILTLLKLSKEESKIEFQHDLKLLGGSWENTIEIATPFDGLQQIRVSSKQSAYDAGTQHQTEGTLNGKRFAATFSKSDSSTRGSTKLAAAGSFTSDWTESLSFEVQHEDDGKQLHPVIILRSSSTQPLRLEVVYDRSSNGKDLKIEANSSYAKPVALHLGYSSSEVSKKSFLNLAWDSVPQVKFDADVFLSESAGYSKLSLSTPITDFQNINFDANFDLTGAQKTGTAVLLYNGNTIQVTAYARGEAALYDAQISLSTPFQSFESLLASGNIDLASKKAKVALKRGSKETTLEGTVQTNGSQFSITAAFTSPFSGFEKIIADGSFDLGSNSKGVQVNLDFNGKRSEIEGSFITQKKQGSLNVRISLPLKGFANTSLKTGYDFSRPEKSLFATVQQGNDSQKLKVQGVLEASSGKFSATMEAPALQIESLVIGGTYTTDNARKNGQLSLLLNGKRVELEGSLSVRKTDAEIVLNAVTDIKGFESISLNAKYDSTKPEKVASLTAAKGSDRIDISGKINMRNTQKVEATAEIKTPFKQLASAEISAKYDIRKADKSAEIILTKNSETVKLAMNGNVSGLQGKLNGRLTTPFRSWELLSGELAFNLETPQKSIVAFMENNNNRKEFNVHFRLTNSGIEARLATPFADFEQVSLSAEYSLDLTQPRFMVKGAKNEKKFELTASGALDIAQKEINLEARVPFAGWEVLSFSSSWNFIDAEKIVIAKLKRNAQYFNVDISGAFSQLKSEAKLAVSTSCKEWNSFGVQANYDAREAISGSLSIEKNGEIQTFSGEALLSGGTAKIALATPFDGYRNMGLSGKLTSTTNEKTAALNFQREDASSDFAFSFKFDQSSVAVNARTPFQNYENLSAHLRFNPESSTGSVVLTKNEDRVEVSCLFNIKPTVGELTFRFVSSIQNFETLELNTKYSLSGKSKSATLVVSKNGKKLEVSAAYSKSRSGIQLTGNLSTPFRSYERLSSKLEINLSANSFTFVAEKNDWRHEFNGSASWDERSISANLGTTLPGFETFGFSIRFYENQLEVTASTPFKGYETVSVSATYNLDSVNKIGRAVITCGKDRFENEILANIGTDLGEMSLRMELPIFKPKVQATVTYNIQGEEKSAMVSLQTEKRYEAGIKARSIESSASVAFKALTPFIGYEELDISASYDVNERSAFFSAERNGKPEARVNVSAKVSALTGIAALQLDVPKIFTSDIDSALSYALESDFSSFEGSLKVQDMTARLSATHKQLKSGSISVTTSLGAFRNGDLEWNLATLQSFNVNLNINDQSIKFALTGKLNNLSHGTIQASLATAFFDTQSLSLEWNAAKKGRFTSDVSHVCGNKTYNMRTEITYGATGSVAVTLKTPITDWEEIAINGRYSNKKDFTSDIRINLNQVQLVEASFSGKITAAKSTAKAALATSRIGNLAIEVSHNFSGVDKTASLAILYNLKRVHLDLQASIPSALRSNARLSLTTPFEGLNSVVLSGAYDLESDRKDIQLTVERDADRCDLRVNLETSPSAASTASVVFTCPCLGIEEWRFEGSYDTSDGVTTTAVTTWAPEKSIRVAFGLSSTGLTAKINTPFEGYQSAEFLISFDFNNSEQNVQSSISFQDKRITISAFWTIKSPGIDFRVVLNTPFLNFESIELRGNYAVTADRKASLVYTHGGRSIELSGNVITSDDGTQASLSFFSPSGEAEEITATVEYSFGSSQKAASVVLRRGAEKIVLSALGELGTKLTALISMEAPFMEVAKISVDIPLSDADKNARIALEYGEKKIEASGIVSIARNGSKIRGSIATPFSSLKKMNVNLRVSEDSFDFALEYARGKTIQLTGNYEFSATSFKMNANLDTPFASLEKLALDTVIDLNAGFDGRFNFRWGLEKSVALSASVQQHSASFSIQTPLEELRNLKLRVQCQTDADYVIGGEVELNEYQGSFEGRYITRAQNTQLGGHASWNWQTVSFESQYRNEDNNTNASIKLNTPFEAVKNFGANFETVHSDNQFSTTFKIETPFEAVPSVSGGLDVKLDAKRGILMNLSGSAADKTAMLQLSVSREASKYSAALQVEVPFIQSLRFVTVRGDFEVKATRNVNGVISLTLPSGEYEVKGSVSLTQKELNFFGSVNTPKLRKELRFGGEYEVKAEQTGGLFKAHLWDNKFTAQYDMDNNKLNAEARITLPALQKNMGLNLEANFRGFRQVEAAVSLDLERYVHKVAFNYQLTNGRFMGQIELDTPVYSTKRILTTSVKYNAPLNFAIEAKLLGKDSHELFASLNTVKTIKGEARLNCPSLGNTNIAVELGTSEGKLYLQVPSGSHRFQYTLRNDEIFEFTAEAESPALQTPINVRSIFRNNEKRSEGSITLQIGNEFHTISGECNHASGAVTAAAKVESSLLPGQSASVEANYICKDRLDAGLNIAILGKTHRFTGVFEKQPKYSVEFTADSHLLPFSTLIFASHVQVTDSVAEAEGSLTYGDKAIRILGNSRYNQWRDVSGMVSVSTPFKTFSSAHANGHFNLVNGLSSGLKIQTSLASFPELSFAAKVQRNEQVLEASTTVSVPVKHWENIELTVTVPLSGAAMRFDSMLSTPTGQHSLMGELILNDNKVELRGEAYALGKKGTFSLLLAAEDVYQIKLELNTPFKGFEKYSWDLRGQIDVKQWGEALAYLDWNGKRIEFTSNIKAENLAYVAVFQLNTPFASYDRFALHLRFEDTDRKSLQAELEYPGSRVGAEFDYVFNGLTDFICKSTLNIPLAGLERFTIEVSNRLTGSSFSGNIEARFGNYGAAFNIDAAVKETSAEMSIEARYNDQVAVLRTNGGIANDALDGSLALNTPFESLRNVDSYFHIERDLSAKNNGFGLSVNGNKIILVTISSLEGSRIIEIQNPVRPIAISYSFERGNLLTNIEAQFCWNLNRRTESSLGGQIVLKNTSQGKQISVKSLIPGRVINWEYAHAITSSKLEQSVSLSWAEGKSAGYKLLLEDASSRQKTQLDAIFRVDFPVRSFEVESHHIVSNGETSTCIELKWDAARDRNKRMGARIETSDLSSWTKEHRKAALFLVHSALEQDIVLKGELTKHNSITEMKTELSYSPFEEHNFSAETRFGQAESYVFAFAAKHPVSRLDLRVESEATLGSQESVASIRIDMLSKDDIKRFFQLSGKIGQQVELGIRTTDKSALVSYSLVRSKSNYQLVSRITLNDLDVYALDAQVDASSPMTKLTLTSPYGTTLNINGGLPSNKEITARVTRDVMGKTIVDGQFNIKLNTTEIFSSRIYWRPSSFAELRNGASTFVLGTISTAKTTVSDAVSFISKEVTEKKINVVPSLSKIASRVIDYERSELESIAADFSGMISYFQEMYNNNELYIRDLHQIGKRVTSATHPQVKVIARSLRATYDLILGKNSILCKAAASISSSATRAALEAWRQLSYSASFSLDTFASNYEEIAVLVLKYYSSFESYMKDTVIWVETVRTNYIGRFEEVVMAEVEKMRQAAIRAVSDYAQKYKPYIDRVTELARKIQGHIETLKEGFNGFSQKIKQQLLKYAPLRRTFDLWLQYGSWLEEFHASEYIEIVTDYVEKFARDYGDRFNAATSRYKPYVEAISQAVEGQFTTIKQIPIVAYISTIAERTHEQVQQFWKYVELEEKIRLILRDSLRHADLITSQLASDLQGSLDVSFNPTYVFEPETGRIELTLYLPVRWESLYESPKLIELPFIKKTNEAKKNFLDNFDMTQYYYAIMDAFATYRPLLDLENVIPPFRSHAMIAGTQHYMTFDKKFYEFAGECSYLLVSDFVNNNFSAVVNYEGSNGKVTRKSLTILSNGRQIDIDSMYRVTVNNRKVELPVVYEKTVVKRDGHRIAVSNENGFLVECNLHQDLCTVHVTGWSFGKTGGLFGVYNHEPRDDFLTPFRQLKSDNEVDSFANSWKVGTSRCRVRNYAVEATSPSIRNSRLCDELFTDEASTLRPCFRMVDPAPFIRMCLNDLASLENSPKKDLGVCTAAAAYVTECRSAGVDLWVPSRCVRCEVDNNNVMVAGDIRTFNGDAPRSADVVFVVDQKLCLKNTRLSGLPNDLDAALKEQGLVNNRFAVVGFGGKGPFNEPHIRTAEGQVWSNRKGIQAALEDMPLNGEKKTDVFAALRYASSLQYRAGVSKQIILVTCVNDCEASGYADALSLLLENDIKVHLLQPRDIMVRGKQGTEELKGVFGFDSEQVYTVRSVRRLVGDRQLRRQLVIPKDFCTPLAMETNGTLFDVNKLSRDDPLLAKKFSDVFARRVALTAEPSECQRCDCVGDSDGAGSVICQRCVPPSLDKFIKDWEKLAYESELENEAVPEDFTVVAEIKEKAVAKNPKRGNKKN